MDIRIQQGKLTEIAAEVLMVLAPDKDSPRDPDLDAATGGWLGEIYESGEFPGSIGDLALLYKGSGLAARRFAVAGSGKAGSLGSVELRRAIGAAVRILKGKALRNLHLFLPTFLATPENVQAAVEAAILGDYEPDALKTCDKKGDKRLESFTICVETSSGELEAAVERGRIVAESQNFARDMVNEPANLLTPLRLAEYARTMAGEFGLECEVLDEPAMRELGMGSLLGVAMGSDNPPALIVLRYQPEGDGGGSDHLALVGKGVTFDTGGVSIKPSEGMEKMKYDMGGAGAVIGAMRALAQLRPSVRVTAFIPTVENMVSGRAQRPGDIVKSMNGKTVEVLNTDAEGRLILIDAITYAIRQGCTHFVDAATLTGAIVVALGHIHVGAFSNNDELFSRIATAAAQAGDRMWRMPLDEDYKEYLKSPFADLPNIGGRWGGAITAAKFLEEFVEGKPWVHLDIAGTAWLDDGKPWLAKGPSGVPVRTFVNLALNWNRG
ncbi:MAG TPA: leucyl aminopeptidase [Bryobacteraceae bacterium]|nr:leucyl aminopeptidase [Bryobacteraceae bacterium]